MSARRPIGDRSTLAGGWSRSGGRTLETVKQYYDAAAAGYDEWYSGLGRFDGLDQLHWDDELRELERTIAGLTAVKTLDVACGTGFLTRHLRGEVTGLDQSKRMLALAREQAPTAAFVHGDAFDLPFPDESFDRVFAAHFYGHLEEPERVRFLAEARRVAPQLVVVDAAVRPDRQAVERQERILDDGSRWEVYKRYFTAERLVSELGGATILFEGSWFVVVAHEGDPVRQ